LKARLIAVDKIEITKEKCHVVRTFTEVIGNFIEKAVFAGGRQVRFDVDVDEAAPLLTNTNRYADASAFLDSVWSNRNCTIIVVVNIVIMENVV
jgi:hypothetical protein